MVFKQIREVGTEKIIPDNTDMLVIQQTDGATRPIKRENFLPAAIPQLKYIQLLDKRTQNTVGGTANTTAWTVRTLNTKAYDPNGLAVISSNQFVLTAGDYVLDGSFMFYRVGRQRIRLRNTTDNTIIMHSMSAFTPTLADGVTDARISGAFSIASNKHLVFEYRLTSSFSSNDLGLPSFLAEEIYSMVNLWKT